MAFEHQARAQHAPRIQLSVDARVGKRTLTEQLPATAIQRKPAEAAPRAAGTHTIASDAAGGAPDDPISASIAKTLADYQGLKVDVPLPDRSVEAAKAWEAPRRGVAEAKVPYWNSRYVKPQDPKQPLEIPAGYDATARGNLIAALGAKGDDAVFAGKGAPTQIGQVVHQAIELGLLARPALAVTASDEAWLAQWHLAIEPWLTRVGVGVDCSGFVYNALINVRADNEDDIVTSKDNPEYQPRDRKWGILDGYPTPSSGATLASDEEMRDMGNEIKPPTEELRPGDTMYAPGGVGHVRIVITASRSDGMLAFTTAESTADARSAADPTSGPRLHQWRYNGAQLEHQFEGAQDAWESTNEKPIFRRHLARKAPAATPTAQARRVQLKAAGEPARLSLAKPAGGGAALPAPTRSRMERAFGADFSSVRVHEGDHASELGAQAYAEGDQLHFAPGRYAPGTSAGDQLIGHELAHVVQQREGRVAAPQGKDGIVEDAGLEAEADQQGEAAAAGRPARAQAAQSTKLTTAVQRKVVLDAGGGGDAFASALHQLDGLITRRADSSAMPSARTTSTPR